MQSQANAADAERPLRRVIEASSDEANEKALHDIASAFFYRASSSGLAEEIADLQKQLRSLRGELAQQVSDAAEASAKAVGNTAADLADKVDTSALDDMRNRLTKRAGTVADTSTAYLKDVADKVDADAVDDMRERLEDTVTDAAETSAAFMRSAASDVAEKVDPPSLEDIRQIVAEQIARIDLDDLREKGTKLADKVHDVDLPDPRKLADKPAVKTAIKHGSTAAAALNAAPAPIKLMQYGLAAGALFASIKFGYDKITKDTE